MMKPFVEPEREVMRRLCFGGGAVSLAKDHEPRLYEAAEKLVVEGYLFDDGPFVAGGLWYRRFTTGQMTDMLKLKEWA